jgi:hypothetical protein
MNTIETIKISNDKGNTWLEEEIDIRDVDPQKSKLKVGDWIERNGVKYEIKLTTGIPEEHKNNKAFREFEKYTNLLYASPIDIE